MGDAAQRRLLRLAEQLAAPPRGSSHQPISHQAHTDAAPAGRAAPGAGGSQPRPKACSAEEAVALVPSCCCITVGGFVGTGCPEHLLNALRLRFDLTLQPRGLAALVPVSSGDR
jgi:hypothetical protein